LIAAALKQSMIKSAQAQDESLVNIETDEPWRSEPVFFHTKSNTNAIGEMTVEIRARPSSINP
jgi:hypothetical protein